jgi:hypothetical protein
VRGRGECPCGTGGDALSEPAAPDAQAASATTGALTFFAGHPGLTWNTQRYRIACVGPAADGRNTRHFQFGRWWRQNPPAVFENNIELYSPGYLFEGERPEITSAPDTIHYGTSFEIEVSHSIDRIRLIRLGAATHGVDMDQRSVGLSFNPTNGSFMVTAPANANVAPPGMYMLFVLRPKSASLTGETRIPSVAKVVNVRYPAP